MKGALERQVEGMSRKIKCQRSCQSHAPSFETIHLTSVIGILPPVLHFRFPPLNIHNHITIAPQSAHPATMTSVPRLTWTAHADRQMLLEFTNADPTYASDFYERAYEVSYELSKAG